MISNTIKESVETEGARRATGVSTDCATLNRNTIRSLPDPEVAEKALRRKFTASYKLCILQEADTCTAPGQMGALVRREGLYSSNLTPWRRQRERGTLEALSPKYRGPKAKRWDPSAHRSAELEQENIHLKQKRKQAETSIEVQKKSQKFFKYHSARERRHDARY